MKPQIDWSLLKKHGLREPDERLHELLARAYAQYLVHSGALIVERKPGNRGFLELVSR